MLAIPLSTASMSHAGHSKRADSVTRSKYNSTRRRGSARDGGANGTALPAVFIRRRSSAAVFIRRRSSVTTLSKPLALPEAPVSKPGPCSDGRCAHARARAGSKPEIEGIRLLNGSTHGGATGRARVRRRGHARAARAKASRPGSWSDKLTRKADSLSPLLISSRTSLGNAGRAVARQHAPAHHSYR
jgi:hypothetical protein